MPEFRTSDGRYLFIEQGDGNAVVYLTSPQGPMVPVWDRWSFEARGDAPPSAAPLPVPAPAPAAPMPVAGAGRVVRVTNESDGTLVNRMYSYWSSAWIGPETNTVYVFAGHVDGRPRFFRVNPATGDVFRFGPLLAYGGEAEGWYWDAAGWIYLCDGPRLRRVNPFSGDDRVVFDISGTFPGCDLWQCHSSEDGRTHSATVRQLTASGSYPKLGTVVYRDGALLRFEAPTLGDLDESAISGNGRYLLIKEGPDDDNRIFDLDARTERVIRKGEGALGHSDTGPDWAIGDDRTVGGATWVNLAHPDDRRVLVRFPDWNMGHVSVQAGRCLLTHADLITLLDPATGVVTVLTAHGMIVGPGDPYDYQANANLDPCGQVVVFMSNKAGRMDVYLLVL